MKNSKHIRFLKFIFVGVLNTLIGEGSIFLLYNLFHASYWCSSAFGYIIGGVFSFFLNKFFTFKNHEKSLRQVVFFIITLAICYIVSFYIARIIGIFILSGAGKNLRENISILSGIFLYTILNYFCQCFLVFKKKEVVGK